MYILSQLQRFQGNHAYFEQMETIPITAISMEMRIVWANRNYVN